MESLVLAASKREEKGKITRREGFIPAVVYARGEKTQPVKLKKANLDMILKKYGARANIKVKLDDRERLAIIKDVERNPLTNDILHVDLQFVEETEVVNWEIPVIYVNKEELEFRRMSLSISFSVVEVIGRVKDIPDFIEVDVGSKTRNDTITIADLNVNPKIKFKKQPDTILAAVK